MSAFGDLLSAVSCVAVEGKVVCTRLSKKPDASLTVAAVGR